MPCRASRRPGPRRPRHGSVASKVCAPLAAARTLLSHSPLAALATDAMGRVQWLNPAMARATGLTPAQAHQRGPWAVLLGSGTPVAERRRMARALRDGQAMQALAQHLRPDGTACWLRLDVQPLADADGRSLGGHLAVGVDVTAEHAGAARARQLVDHAAAGILVQDGGGHITECNAEAERLLGLPRQALLGLTGADRAWRALGGDGLPMDQHPAMATLADGRPRQEILLALERADGERRWLRLNTARLGQGACAQVTSSFTDVTGQMLAYANLSAERERLAGALQGTRAGVWSWDDTLGELHLDAACAGMLGHAPQDLQKMPAAACRCCTWPMRATIWSSASCVYGTGSKSCVWPCATPVQHKWSETHAGCTWSISALSLVRYSEFSGSTVPIDSATPCITIG